VRIAVDVDGVCCDLHVEWLRRYNRDWNDTMTPADIKTWHVHEHVKPECGKNVYAYLNDSDLYDKCPPIQDALAGVRRLREMGHEVVIVTDCAVGMTDQKAAWLVRHGFLEGRRGMLPRDLVITDDKTRVDAHLLVDDGAHHVRAWVEDARRRAILVERPWNASLVEEAPSAFWSWCDRERDWSGIARRVYGRTSA